MIKVLSVSGQVAIDDRMSCREAFPSMEISTTGRPILIVSGPTGYAALIKDGHQINLGPNSFLLCGEGSRPRRWSSKAYTDLKFIVGKLWSHIDTAPHEDDSPSAVIGIRG